MRLDKSSLCGGKIINIYDSGCLTKKFMLAKRTFLPSKSKHAVIVREIALILVELFMQHQRRVSHGSRLKSSQSYKSCKQPVLELLHKLCCFCFLLCFYRMSFTTDFIALAWGNVKCEQPGHLSLGVYVLASTGPMDHSVMSLLDC